MRTLNQVSQSNVCVSRPPSNAPPPIIYYFRSISEQRRALVENQKLKRQYELESMASIQLILISSFSRYVPLDIISLLLCNFNLEVINAPFMTKIEGLLSFIGSRLGSSGSAGTANGSTQVDVKRIKKRLHSILTRLRICLI